MSEFGRFLVGCNAGMLAIRLVYWRSISSYRAEYQRYIRQHEAELDALKARNEQRYIDLRKRLGLPPRDQEWS